MDLPGTLVDLLQNPLLIVSAVAGKKLHSGVDSCGSVREIEAKALVEPRPDNKRAVASRLERPVLVASAIARELLQKPNFAGGCIRRLW
jgi:hypothetical protein